MIKRTLMGLALGLLALAPACDDSPEYTEAYCPMFDGRFCAPPGLPYVTALASRSDACPDPDVVCEAPLTQTTATLTMPESGKVCMKGTVAGREGFAWIIFEVSRWTQAQYHIIGVFDAKALGITELHFNIENPPVTGITLFATTPHASFCSQPGGCLTGFDLKTGPRSSTNRVITQSGAVSAPFTDFVAFDPNTKFNTAALAHFIFVLGAGDYDFCISGFKFVDASGNEISPSTPDGGASEGG